jgi:hypothetical protein
MTGRALAAAFLLLFSVSHKRGEVPPLPPRRVLNVSGTAKLEVRSFAAFGEPRSDDRGNLYFHAATRSYNNSALIGISRTDAQPKFLLLPDEFAKKTSFESFFVTPSGTVYLVAETHEQSRIVFEFDSDGELAHHTALNSPPDVSLGAVAAFEDGNFFASGYYGSKASPTLRGKPFVGIFDSSGTLIRELSNSRIATSANLGQSPTTAKPSELWSCLGDDGNLYFLASDQILVISESGGIVRRIKFPKPEKASATRLEVSGGLGAVWLEDDSGPNQTIRLQLETIDLSTGKATALYSPSEELGNNAVSFSRTEGFVFMRWQDGKVVLLTAALT